VDARRGSTSPGGQAERTGTGHRPRCAARLAATTDPFRNGLHNVKASGRILLSRSPPRSENPRAHGRVGSNGGGAAAVAKIVDEEASGPGSRRCQEGVCFRRMAIAAYPRATPFNLPSGERSYDPPSGLGSSSLMPNCLRAALFITKSLAVNVRRMTGRSGTS
jgi:hypothetical protein